MSTQTQGVRNPPLRGYRRRKTVLDLNVPPSEGRDDEGASSHAELQGVQASQQGQSLQTSQQGQSLPPAAIDVDAFDDDVIESSPRAFAEAKKNARRAHGGPVVVDVESVRTNRLTHNNRNKRRRSPPNQTIINCDLYINLESSSSPLSENLQPLLPPQSSQKEPTFNCPICLGPFTEEMSTKCGHIFCNGCIMGAIKAQAKCPTCRKRVTAKELIRVFLPATS